MSPGPTYNRKIEESAPLIDNQREKVERDYGLSYRQDIGQLVYGMVTCMPDIS